MSNTPDTIDDSATLELQAAEILAFELMSLSLGPDTDREEAREHWQASAQLRTEWRCKAKDLRGFLGDGGVRIRVGERRSLCKQLDWLMTIPPRSAYSVEQEARKGAAVPASPDLRA